MPPAPRPLNRLREPEIEQFDGAVGSDLDIGGFEIAMDDALVVRGFERLRDLPRDSQRFVERNPALSDAIGQRQALDVFHDERRHTAGALEAVDTCDVGMIQQREHFGFALEPGKPIDI